MDDRVSHEIQRPLVVHVASISRYSPLPETYDHWDLPEAYDHWDLPEVYIPVITNNERAIVPYSPRVLGSPPSSSCGPGNKSATGKSFWRRHWAALVALGVLLVGGGLGGGLAAVMLSRRAGGDSATTSSGPNVSTMTVATGTEEHRSQTLWPGTSSGTTTRTEDPQVTPTPSTKQHSTASAATRTSEPSSFSSTGSISLRARITSGSDVVRGSNTIMAGDVSTLAGAPSEENVQTSSTGPLSPGPETLGPSSTSNHISGEPPSPTASSEINREVPYPRVMNQPEPSSNAKQVAPQQPVIIGRTRLHGATEDQEEIAFYIGQECNYSFITKLGGPACGVPFTLAGQVYTWEGCGGPIWVQSADPTTQPWHGDCTWIPDFEPVDCGPFDVRAGWSCGPNTVTKRCEDT